MEKNSIIFLKNYQKTKEHQSPSNQADFEDPVHLLKEKKIDPLIMDILNEHYKILTVVKKPHAVRSKDIENILKLSRKHSNLIIDFFRDKKQTDLPSIVKTIQEELKLLAKKILETGNESEKEILKEIMIEDFLKEPLINS